MHRRKTHRLRRRQRFVLCALVLVCAAGARADHRSLVLNFDQDVQFAGQTGVFINGTPFLASLLVGQKDDDARDTIGALIDAHADFGTVWIGDATLWVFATGSAEINNAVSFSKQGTDVRGLIVGADVLMVDVDPKDTSPDVETNATHTMGTAAAALMVVDLDGTFHNFDPDTSDDDLSAAAGLLAAGIGAVPGAVRIGAAILLPHCALQESASSSSDANLGVFSVEMDVHIPCLTPPGDTSVPGGAVPEHEVDAASPAGRLALIVFMAVAGLALARGRAQSRA